MRETERQRDRHLRETDFRETVRETLHEDRDRDRQYRQTETDRKT